MINILLVVEVYSSHMLMVVLFLHADAAKRFFVPTHISKIVKSVLAKLDN